MRIALLADIHANSIALDAVLTDLDARGGADAYWVLGDLVGLGPDPVGVLARLGRLPNLRLVRGNNDRYVATGERPFPSAADAAADPALIPRLVEMNSGFAWTQGLVSAAGQLDWLAALPLTQRQTLLDGTRLLGVHASLDGDEDPGIEPDIGDATLATLFAGAAADLIAGGHTHRPVDRTVNGVRYVNPGAVANAPPPDLRAGYALLAADVDGYALSHYRIDYDRQAAIDQLYARRCPNADFVAAILQGEWRL